MDDHDNTVLSLAQAAEQAADYFGFLASRKIDLGDGGPLLEIPNPQLLSPDQQDRVNAVRVAFEDCDREEIELSDGKVIKGGYKEPRRRKGKLVTPSYDVQLAIAVWGEDDYKRFAAAGGKPGLISMVWAQMDDQFSRRRERDPK